LQFNFDNLTQFDIDLCGSTSGTVRQFFLRKKNTGILSAHITIILIVNNNNWFYIWWNWKNLTMVLKFIYFS